MLIEWGDAITPVLPPTTSRCASRSGPATTTACSPSRAIGPGWAARARRPAPRALAPWMDRLMLILGIDTATAQVGCAIGGHEGVLGVDPLDARAAATPRRSPRPSSSSAARPASSSPRSASSPSTSGPGCSPACGSASRRPRPSRTRCGCPMIGVASLDLLAFPLRHSNRLIVAAIDARRGELFYAFYRQVPGGVQRLSEPEVGHARRPRLASCWPRARSAARRRRRPALPRGVRRAHQGRDRRRRGWRTRRPRSLVQLAHARALREEFVQPWEPHAALPAQARRRDQLADAGHGAVMAQAEVVAQPDPRRPSTS